MGQDELKQTLIDFTEFLELYGAEGIRIGVEMYAEEFAKIKTEENHTLLELKTKERNKLLNAKLTLFNLLCRQKEDEQTNREVDIMYELSKDKQIQEWLDYKQSIEKNENSKRNIKRSC